MKLAKLLKVVFICTLSFGGRSTAPALGEATEKSAVNDGVVSAKSGGANDRQLSIKHGRRWKERVGGRAAIPYRVSSVFSMQDKEKISDVLRQLEVRTGCLYFIERTNQRNYIEVVRKTDQGCSSQIGVGMGKQNLNLENGCMSTSTIQHEFMHALGFHHEQVRSDRDNYVTVIWENVKSRKIYEVNFRKISPSEGFNLLGSPYELASIMHYSTDAFRKVKGQKTIVPKGNGVIRRSESASDTDIKKIKLVYQCDTGVRDWNSLIRNPCTTSCKCRVDDFGCGSNDDACHGSFVCSNNKCVNSRGPVPAPSPSPPVPSPSPSAKPWLIYSSLHGTDPFHCIDLKGKYTANGNRIIYYPCNFTPAQIWFRDSNNYIRSKIDKNKCIVPVGGGTDRNTEIMIHDCLSNDDRFVWDIYTDKSIRPRNNNHVCIGPNNVWEGDFQNLILDGCNDDRKEFSWLDTASSGPRRLGEHNSSASKSNEDENGTNPSQLVAPRRLDIGNQGVNFTSADDFNCEEFGDTTDWDGVTANEACCAYGGGFDVRRPNNPNKRSFR